jgi:hypothetical protein
MSLNNYTTFLNLFILNSSVSGTQETVASQTRMIVWAEMDYYTKLRNNS